MYDHIELAIDGSECSMRAARRALGLALLKPGMKIDLVNVVSAENEIDALYSPEVFDEVENGSVLAPAMQLFEGSRAVTRAVLLHGAPADCIARYARENGVDTIVMGSRGLSGFQKFRVGSVSERVIKLSECPVLVVK